VRFYSNPGIDHPWGIAVGRDGAIWFTNPVGNSIGRITPGGDITIFTHPGIRGPQGIAPGPDGAIWFTNHYGDSIGRITMRGSVRILRGR
jgi:virginiamycin B lyase